MVAKTPSKEKRGVAVLNPNLVRETVNKVDRCMARLQELQYTVSGGLKVVSGVNLSPRSTRGYLRTSLRCKQESLRMKTPAARKSPAGNTQLTTNGEWKRMSLPAMLLGETVVEILQASRFTKEVAIAGSKLPTVKRRTDPKTPDPINRSKKLHCEGVELRTRRMREKQRMNRGNRNDCYSPPLTRARSRITFKPNSPPIRTINSRPSVAAHRMSPKNRPWAKKTVLFPNSAFISSPSASSSCQQKFYKTRSPIIGRTKQQQTTPHKFLIKSPSSSLKSQQKSKNKLTPPERKVTGVTKVRRCSFSPSKLASRLVSPLKNRISLQKMSPFKGRIPPQIRGNQLISGLKQRPIFSTPVKISSGRRILSVG